MGTHPIFESDFDCLTEKERENDEIVIAAAGADASSGIGACN